MKTVSGPTIAVKETSSLMQSANMNGNEQAKPTHQNIIRLAPPLVISEEQIKTALKIIEEAIEELPNLKGKKEEKVLPEGERNVHVELEN
ncbi:ornithine aminotransferase [Taxawa tesnikishii (nom. ined.)]|nr:ornithine aminotransferase [Dothideales sp. JES 119]